MNLTIEVTHEQRGQRGNYAPHRYASRLRFTSAPGQGLPNEAAVLRLARTLVHDWRDCTGDERDSSMDAFYSPKLQRCEKVLQEGGTSEWFIVVEQPYTD